MSVQPGIGSDLTAVRPPELAVLLRGSSMRLLEGGLALVAIVTAFLLGQVH
ncbi:MAG: hypothetical protein ABIZ52_00475 [Candidatus Limnocylindrales bacterium]